MMLSCCTKKINDIIFIIPSNLLCLGGSMEILLNGTLYSLTSGKKLVDILKKLNFSSGAVAVNNAIVHKEDFNKVILNNNDKVDIVHVVGGG